MGKIRILIADTMAETIALVKKVLYIEQDSFEVAAETSKGQEVLELIPQVKPHVVLMDMIMPDLSGLEATQQISRDFPHVSVIMMSVQSEDEYVRKAFEAGAKDFIVKPFNYNVLLESIKSAYKQSIDVINSSVFNDYVDEHQYNPARQQDLEYGDKDGLDCNKEFLEDIGQFEKDLGLIIDDNHRGVSINLGAGSCSTALLKQGTFVDVIGFFSEKIQDSKVVRQETAKVILQNIKVAAVENYYQDETTLPSIIVTLSVYKEDVEKLILAENIGKLKLVLKSPGETRITSLAGATWEEVI